MKWFEYPFALLGVLLVAALAPPWIWFVNEHLAALDGPTKFLAQLVLPAILLLFLVSWVDPNGV